MQTRRQRGVEVEHDPDSDIIVMARISEYDAHDGTFQTTDDICTVAQWVILITL